MNDKFQIRYKNYEEVSTEEWHQFLLVTIIRFLYLQSKYDYVELTLRK